MRTLEYLLHMINEKIKEKNEKSLSKMTAKEKWMLFLLGGLLFAVVVFPSGKEQSENGNTKSSDITNGQKSAAEGTLGSGMGAYGGMLEGGTSAYGGVTEREMSAYGGVTAAEANAYEGVQGGNASVDAVYRHEAYLSARLEKILGQLEGVGSVSVWVTLAGSEEAVLTLQGESEYSLLEEADSVGGTRSEEKSSQDKSVVTERDGKPYIVKTLQPEVEGVLVVAEGAGSSVVKKNISEAVEVLFGIEAHRIKVAKKKVEE